MIKYAAQHNALDEEKTFYEMLLSLKRAGAGKIITYAAKEIAQRLHSSS
jgi:delta-aminolevulinic acid dehydratase/porphobilinogen synthase